MKFAFSARTISKKEYALILLPEAFGGKSEIRDVA